MQPKEMPRPTVEFSGQPPISSEALTAKEKPWFTRLGTAIRDTVRDIDTASRMAADTLEETAFKHIFKGGMTSLVGVGLEHALEGTWQGAVEGKALLSRPPIEFSLNTRNQLTALEKSNPSLYRFIKQASTDLATGVIYNGLAFFSRPMFKSAEGEHLLASLAVDVADAFSPQLVPKENKSTLGKIFTGSLKYSNPATLLGLHMITRAGGTLWKNMKEVRKVRKEKGGLEGKKVYIPKKEHRWKQEDRKPGFKEKVYYGRGNWQNQQQEEEEVLEKFS